MPRHGSLVVALLVACGGEAEAVELAAFDRLCGIDGPVPLLELADGERMTASIRTQSGDLLVRTSIHTTSDEGVSEWTHVGTWLIDACGEHRRAVPEDFLRTFEWEGLTLATQDDEDLVEVDAHGNVRVLARRGAAAVTVGTTCVARDAPFGASIGRLVGIRPGPEGAIVETLVPEMITSPTAMMFFGVAGDDVFARTPDSTLVRAHVPTGEMAVELERVARGYSVSTRYLVYRSLPEGTDPFAEPGDTPQPLILRNRQHGTETILGDVPASLSVGVNDVVVSVNSWRGGSWPPRWFWAEDGREILPPTPGVRILEMEADGLAWLLRADDFGAPATKEWFRWRPGEEPRMVMSCWRCEGTWTPGGLDVLEAVPRRLSRVRSEGGFAFEIAARVGGRYQRRHDDRVLTLHDEIDDYGTLVLYDYRDGGTPKIIGTDVHEGTLTSLPISDDPDEFLYEQRHPDGSHTLYRARLLPAE